MEESVNESPPRKGGLALGLHTVFLSLNVGFASTFAVLIFKYTATGLRASAFYFLQPANIFFTRRAAEVDRLLHLSIGSDAGAAVVACASILFIALTFLILLRCVGLGALGRTLFEPIGLVSATALLPVLYLYVLQSTQGWDYIFPFWSSRELSIFLLQVPLVWAFFLLARDWRHRAWVGAVILALHYSVWTGLLWWTFIRIPLRGPKLFYFVFPCSGFAWLLYTATLQAPGKDVLAR